MSSSKYFSVDERLPRTGDTVIAKYEGVYTNRKVVFWRDYDMGTHFGRIDEPDGRGSQPATHWKPV